MHFWLTYVFLKKAASLGILFTNIVRILAGNTWWADTLLSLVENETLAWRTGLDWGALDGGVSLVALLADADHGPDGQGVQDLAEGVEAAGVVQETGVLALAPDASLLGGAVGVNRATDLHTLAGGATGALESQGLVNNSILFCLLFSDLTVS